MLVLALVVSVGIASGKYSGGSVINCFSGGSLSKLSGTRLDESGMIAKKSTLTNCYYLDGIDENVGITPETGATVFYKTSDDPEAMTTAKVVAALNNYIELKGVLQEGDAEVDTTGWCKWVINNDNLPVLDFTTEWNGTAWVTSAN